MTLGLCISEVPEEAHDYEAHASNDGLGRRGAGGHESRSQRLIQLVFSRKIGDAIVINDGAVILSIEEIAGGVVSWRRSESRCRHVSGLHVVHRRHRGAGGWDPLHRDEYRQDEPPPRRHGAYQVPIARFEIFKAMQSARSDRPGVLVQREMEFRGSVDDEYGT